MCESRLYSQSQRTDCTQHTLLHIWRMSWTRFTHAQMHTHTGIHTCKFYSFVHRSVLFTSIDSRINASRRRRRRKIKMRFAYFHEYLYWRTTALLRCHAMRWVSTILLRAKRDAFTTLVHFAAHTHYTYTRERARANAKSSNYRTNTAAAWVRWMSILHRFIRLSILLLLLDADDGDSDAIDCIRYGVFFSANIYARYDGTQWVRFCCVLAPLKIFQLFFPFVRSFVSHILPKLKNHSQCEWESVHEFIHCSLGTPVRTSQPLSVFIVV